MELFFLPEEVSAQADDGILGGVQTNVALKRAVLVAAVATRGRAAGSGARVLGGGGGCCCSRGAAGRRRWRGRCVGHFNYSLSRLTTTHSRLVKVHRHLTRQKPHMKTPGRATILCCSTLRLEFKLASSKAVSLLPGAKSSSGPRVKAKATERRGLVGCDLNQVWRRIQKKLLKAKVRACCWKLGKLATSLDVFLFTKK